MGRPSTWCRFRRSGPGTSPPVELPTTPRLQVLELQIANRGDFRAVRKMMGTPTNNARKSRMTISSNM